MKRALLGVVVLGVLLVLGLAGRVSANSAVDGDVPAMMASPQVIVLAKVAELTVHTNIPFAAVAPRTVTLNGIAPTGVWADSCGHLVARFASADLKLAPGVVTLTLEGDLADGGAFSADDVVTVK